MHHRVGQPLFQRAAMFVLPQYSVGGAAGHCSFRSRTRLHCCAVGVALAACTKRRNA